MAALGIVYSPPSHQQRFYKGHTDDILCLTIHDDQDLVATGQVCFRIKKVAVKEVPDIIYIFFTFFTFIYNRSSKMNYFIYTSHHFTPHGRYELNKLTSLPMCGFIAQLVEQRTGNAEVTGSNPVEALIFFRLLLSNCLNWKIYCDDHSSLSSTTAVQK